MNKTLKITVLYVAVLASAFMIVALIITSAVRSLSSDTAAVFSEVQRIESYWLRSFNGHIAVYDGKEAASPILETTIDADGLRAVDKEMLNEGIEAKSYEDVLKLLEDFSS